MAELIAARRLVYCPDCIPGNDVLSIINRLFCGWIVRDRFNILNKYLPLNMADNKDIIPIPDYKTSIKDIIDTRAQEILALNQPITISWSGGVDSTVILCALLANGIAKDQLTVLHTKTSILEYRWLYKELKKEGYRFVQREDLATSFNDVSEGLLITGWCADQLFGSNIHLRNLELYNLPWMDGLKKAIANTSIQVSPRMYTQIEAVWDDYAKQLGFPMEQFCEFAWIYNFGCKWSYVSQDAYLAASTANLRKRIINFFEDKRFESWSVGNYETLRQVNVNKEKKFYKKPLKEYIYSYTQDSEYLEHKGKVNSWATVSDPADEVRVSVLDTEGYHTFKYSGNSYTPDILVLRNTVANIYLKEGF